MIFYGFFYSDDKIPHKITAHLNVYKDKMNRNKENKNYYEKKTFIKLYLTN